MPDNRLGSVSHFRVFLGLYLVPETALRISLLLKPRTRPLQGVWMSPGDLHLTVLFGGMQEEKVLVRWKESAKMLQESISPFQCHQQTQAAEIHWRRDRRILAITFDRMLPFWLKVEETSRVLSEKLLPAEKVRPFWPHLTLARNVRLEQETLESLSDTLHTLFLQPLPLWKGVRLYKSIPSPDRTQDRYQTLADYPFSGNGA
ncbi:MAG: 2'-5' RNA ligase family protein [Leptospirales bacterium]